MEKTGIPLIGLGTFKLCTKTDKDLVYNVLDSAIDAGYRLIDTASCYRNEKDIGDALQKLYAKFKISREDIFITSKVSPKDMGYEAAMTSCLQSISHLQCDYLDCLLIHWPGKSKLKPEDAQHASFRKETWTAFEFLKEQGIVRMIGVSNFTITHLKELLDFAKIKPCLNQVEFHVQLNQMDLLGYCVENDIFLQSYSSLGTGALLDNPTVVEVADKYNKTPAQILLKWVLQQGVGVIPKSTNREHIISNYNINDFIMDKGDMCLLSQLNVGKHYCWDPNQIV